LYFMDLDCRLHPYVNSRRLRLLKKKNKKKPASNEGRSTPARALSWGSGGDGFRQAGPHTSLPGPKTWGIRRPTTRPTDRRADLGGTEKETSRQTLYRLERGGGGLWGENSQAKLQLDAQEKKTREKTLTGRTRERGGSWRVPVRSNLDGSKIEKNPRGETPRQGQTKQQHRGPGADGEEKLGV